MKSVNPTAEDILISMWDSHGRLSKIISVGLILVYVLGLTYSTFTSISSEITRLLFLLWPGIIAYIAISYWLAAVLASNIILSCKNRTRRKKAIYVLLPSLIIASWSTFVSAIGMLISDVDEEESEE